MTPTDPSVPTEDRRDQHGADASVKAGPRWPRATPLLIGLLVLVVSAVAAVGAAVVRRHQPGAPNSWYPAVTATPGPLTAPPACAAPPPTATTRTGASSAPLAVPAVGEDAAAWLRGTATRLTPTAADTTTGRYAHIRRHAWYGDMTPDRHGVGHTDLRVETLEGWFAEDGSGTTITIIYPPGTTEPGAGAKDWAVEREDFGAQQEPHHHLAFTGLPSSDPVQLTRQLFRVQPPRVGDQALIRAAARLVEEYTLPCPVRAALLQVLATSRVVWRGQVTDRAGRPAVAVSVDDSDGSERDTLLLDPATGAVLGYEDVVLRNPGKLAGPFPLTVKSLLFLSADWRDAIDPVDPAATSRPA
ncbi:hypothetical protein AB0M46_21565 [Dactylosporangium sp. NPDC051485]|uniref:hypothetical protein n=1 Tax=Dactylosporangium sp. NPDC051485 TaxID=3154846 RepID=UPI003445F82D